MSWPMAGYLREFIGPGGQTGFTEKKGRARGRFYYSPEFSPFYQTVTRHSHGGGESESWGFEEDPILHPGAPTETTRRRRRRRENLGISSCGGRSRDFLREVIKGSQGVEIIVVDRFMTAIQVGIIILRRRLFREL